MRAKATDRRLAVWLWAGVLFGAPALSVAAADGWEPVRGASLPPWTGVDLEGRPAELDAWSGRVRLVNLWATWCLPCRHEMPRLAALYRERAGEGLVVVGISVDRPEAAARVRQLVEEREIPYPILLDPEERAAELFGAVGLPVNLLFDRRGRLVWSRTGVIGDEDPELEQALAEALEDEPAAGKPEPER